eukprot:TRINITY_DN5301_c0_g2_i1.p1 TRINITY_DN5301_c0_g2~~TRINITY_DN5301_c0_g2_i1.p1  ORF type:complete len:391 (+),score=88.73 TRINITY_DN5301_c0_g2_i1:133-1305(+)
MACLIHGMPGSERWATKMNPPQQIDAATREANKYRADWSKPFKTEARVNDFWSADTPPFMLGPGTGVPKQGPGPGAQFNKIENGDDCQHLSQLERRLQHPQTLPEERARNKIFRETVHPPKPAAAARAAKGFHSPRIVHARWTQDKAEGNLKWSSPDLFTGLDPEAARKKRAQMASKSATELAKPREPALPYKYDEVDDGASTWAKAFVRDAPPGLYTRGLLANDITYANNSMPGVCVMRQMKLPTVADVTESPFQVRMDHVDGQLRNVEAWEKKRKAANARPPSPGGSSQGASGEVLPKHQMMTCGKPSLCRPIPKDALRPGHKQRGRYATSKDSLMTSEYRSNSWWKPVTDAQKHEIKQFVRPYDNWTLFRDNAAKIRQAARFPISTY